MSDVRWEPVEFAYEYRDDVRQAVRAYGQLLQCVRLDLEGPGYDVWTNITLPPDVRLCRAVAAPTWSQEPPTWGDWWCWHRSDEVRRAKVRQADSAGFWKVIFDDGDFALMNKNKNWLGYWWMRYTVPQPPGEVKP